MSGFQIDIKKIEPENGSVIDAQKSIEVVTGINPSVTIVDASDPNEKKTVYRSGMSASGYTVSAGETRIGEEPVLSFVVSKNSGWSKNPTRLEFIPELDSSGAEVRCTPIEAYSSPGQDVSFSLSYARAPQKPSSFQWSKDDVPLSDSPGHIEGANSENLTVKIDSTADEGIYSCECVFDAQKLNGKIVSGKKVKYSTDGHAYVIVVTASKESRYAWIMPGDAVLFRVDDVSSPDWSIVSYQWMKDGTPIQGAESGSFSIPSAELSDSGIYTCLIGLSTGAKIVSGSVEMEVHSDMPPNTLTEGCLGYWPLMYDLDDATGLNSRASMNSTYLSGYDSRFDMKHGLITSKSTSSFASLPRIPSFTQAKFTIAQRFKANALNGSYLRTLEVCQGGPVIYRTNGGNLALVHRGTTDIDTGFQIQIGKWYTLAITRDGMNVKFYIDGKQIYSVNNFSYVYEPSSSGYIRINACVDYTGETMDGFVNNVGIWNRALSPEEVLRLYEYVSNDLTYPFATDRNLHPVPIPEPESNLNDGLFSFYSFDDDIPSDSSGNGRDLTVVAGAISKSDVVPPFSSSSDLSESLRTGLLSWLPLHGNTGDSVGWSMWNGTASFAESDGMKALSDSNLTAQFFVPPMMDLEESSMFFWCRPSADSTTYGGGVCGLGGCRSDGCIECCVKGKNRAGITFGHYVDNGNYAMEGIVLKANETINPNEWIHVGFTYDGSSLKLYKNGSVVASKVQARSSLVRNTNQDSRPFIGASPTNTNTRFKGLVSELGYWKKVLSSDEIAELMARGPTVP